MAELRKSLGEAGNALAGSSSRLLGGNRRIFRSRGEQAAAIKKEARMLGLLLGVCYFRCFGRDRGPDWCGGGDVSVQGIPLGDRGDRSIYRNCDGLDVCGGSQILACDGNSHYVSICERAGSADRTAWGAASAVCTAAGIGLILFLGLGWLLILRACLHREASASEERQERPSIVRPATQVGPTESPLHSFKSSLDSRIHSQISEGTDT